MLDTAPHHEVGQFRRSGDTIAYLWTGLRLNAGLPMYAPRDLGPGYAPVEIFSPPLVGALFRPIVLLPNAQGIWVGAMALVLGLTGVLIVLRVPPAGLIIVALAPEIGLSIMVGNIDAVVIAGLIATWWLLARGREREAGLLLGVLASLKLTPAAIVWWALVTGRRRTVGWSLASVAACALVAMLATEPLIYVRFVEVTLANYGGAMGPASLGELGRTLGLPFATWLPRVALVGGLALVWGVRKRPALAWTIAVVTMFLASPVAAWHALTLLLAGLAPLMTQQAVQPGKKVVAGYMLSRWI